MRVVRLLTILLVFLPADAWAQDAAPLTLLPPPNAKLFSAAEFSRAPDPLLTVRFDRPYAQAGSQTTADMKGRECAGCPRKNLAWPLFDTLWVNVMYNGINHLRGHETARVSPPTWWENMKSGFEWDDNDWGTNQVGHPYQGSNYFTGGRANGLGFYGSAAVAAFGSATWEFYFENNHASFNDLINTTLGGIAIGEVLHRTAWMVRDPTGEGRKKELFATIIDPIGGLTRMVNGDAKRVADKPPTMTPSSVRYSMAAGVMWQGESLKDVSDRALPIVDLALYYGNTREARSIVPYGSFDAVFSLGAGVTQAGIRGRLFGTPFGGHYQFNVLQTFDFIMNPAYDYGGQGVELEVGMTRQVFSGTTLWMAGGGGVTMLGAVNTLAPPPDESDAPPRPYDYGPGFRWSGFIQMSRQAQPYFTIAYQGYHVAVVDGTRSNHVLQRLFLDARIPVRYSLAIGVAGEYFFRKAYFWPAGNRTDEAPQLRAYVAWSSK